jgi:phage terminase small subunit
MKRTTKPKRLKGSSTPNKVQQRIKDLKDHPAKNADRKYTREQLEDMLTAKQQRFCHYYVVDYNGVQAYIRAFKKSTDKKSYKVAGVQATQLLKDPRIKQFMAHIQRDIARECNISKIQIIKNLSKIANANLTDLFDDWITRKELNELKRTNKGLTKAIKKVESKIVKKQDFITKEPFTEEYVKIELHDPLRAQEMILKALGMNEPEKIDVQQETKVNIDISIYSEDEKALLLQMARKNQFKAE